jgi:hypothetical protein
MKTKTIIDWVLFAIFAPLGCANIDYGVALLITFAPAITASASALAMVVIGVLLIYLFWPIYREE